MSPSARSAPAGSRSIAHRTFLRTNRSRPSLACVTNSTAGGALHSTPRACALAYGRTRIVMRAYLACGISYVRVDGRRSLRGPVRPPSRRRLRRAENTGRQVGATSVASRQAHTPRSERTRTRPWIEKTKPNDDLAAVTVNNRALVLPKCTVLFQWIFTSVLKLEHKCT